MITINKQTETFTSRSLRTTALLADIPYRAACSLLRFPNTFVREITLDEYGQPYNKTHIEVNIDGNRTYHSHRSEAAESTGIPIKAISHLKKYAKWVTITEE